MNVNSPRAEAIRPDTFSAEAAVYSLFGKRCLDILLASILLVLAAPVLGLMSLALWIEGGAPVFRQKRVGRNGQLFVLWKMRTMVPDAEERLEQALRGDPALRREWDVTQKLRHDPRITPLGHCLRRTSLDELPQLLNVIRGDMSLVGPRPMLPEQMALYPDLDVYLSMRPGVTGLWQVTARNEQAFARRAQFDRSYRDQLSFRSDLAILGATVGVVLAATGW